MLLVDDKPANLTALEAVLGDDYNVLLAASGDEAIRALQRNPAVDVILMDVQMPGMDGFEAAVAIKKMPGCQDIPIIFITAVYTDDPFIRRGYEVGGIDYFSKPFDPQILRAKVAVYASFRMQSDLLKERERHIRESEELLRVGRKLSSLLERVPVGVLIADLEGRICQTNDAVSRILRSSDAARNDDYGEIIGWWDSDGRAIKEKDGALARAIRHGETSHSEALSIRCCDESEKTILVSASPLRALDGKIVGAVVLIQDVTESRHIEEELETRVTRLVGLGLELEESAASHS